jgi:hypothetical protein
MAGKSRLNRPLAALAVALSVALGGNLAVAEAACKGLEESACGDKADCSWIKGYTRKDSVKVSGHCRTKSGKGESEKKTTASKAESKSKDEDESGKEKKS